MPLCARPCHVLFPFVYFKPAAWLPAAVGQRKTTWAGGRGGGGIPSNVKMKRQPITSINRKLRSRGHRRGAWVGGGLSPPPSVLVLCEALVWSLWLPRYRSMWWPFLRGVWRTVYISPTSPHKSSAGGPAAGLGGGRGGSVCGRKWAGPKDLPQGPTQQGCLEDVPPP